MAQQHGQLLDAGARVVGISVDSTGQNAAMVNKLRLPFPLLSDPDGKRAIKPYGVWHEEASIAKPAAVLLRPDGQTAFRYVGGDFADRPNDDDVIAHVRALDLPPTTQPPPRPGTLRPGPRAVDIGGLPAYYRGAKFAVTAVKGRVQEATAVADVLTAEYDRYLEAVIQLRHDK